LSELLHGVILLLSFGHSGREKYGRAHKEGHMGTDFFSADDYAVCIEAFVI
tara:strand:+ start:383 stop:535 length:153 start_codon:yes stop_codon:yes gene_type:complete